MLRGLMLRRPRSGPRSGPRSTLRSHLSMRAFWRNDSFSSHHALGTPSTAEPCQSLHRLVDDRFIRAEFRLAQELGAHDLVIGEVAMAAAAQKYLGIARRPVDQLAVGGIDPGHQVPLEPPEPAHDQRRMHV